MNRPEPRVDRRPRRARRGAVVLLLVVMLAVLNLVVTAGAVGGRDDASVAVLRVETARAFYAAESAARIVLDQAVANGAWPEAGDRFAVGSTADAVVIQAADGPGSTLVIDGRSAEARRRIMLGVD